MVRVEKKTSKNKNRVEGVYSSIGFGKTVYSSIRFGETVYGSVGFAKQICAL
jgi:hypothetical protein